MKRHSVITTVANPAVDESANPSNDNYLSAAEEARLRKTAILREEKYRGSYSQRAVVEVSLYTGAKVHELVQLNCGDVQLTAGTASLRIPSEASPRVLPLTAQMVEYFKNYLRRKDEARESTDPVAPLICSQNNQRLTLRGWQSAWALACKHAGLLDQLGKPLYNLEAARRTAGRRIYALRRNPHHVQAWLGLDLTSNADRYKPDELHFSTDSLRALIREADQPVDMASFEDPDVNLAMRFYNGTIGVMNRLLAKRLFLQVPPDDPRREMFVARSLTTGRCLFPLDPQRGAAKAKAVVGLVQEMAQDGDAFSLYLLGSAYDEGLGVKQDFEKSNGYYAAAMECGMETAINNFGLQHFFGKGVAQDDGKAFELFLKAASLHEASAMFNLAHMYQHGIGTKQDEQKALRWLRKGALTGEVRCMNNLSYFYLQGVGVPRDEAMAERWFCMSGILPLNSDGAVKLRTPQLIQLAG